VILLIDIHKKVLDGLKFVLTHCITSECGSIFPRKIYTHNLGCQHEVYDINEAMQYFEESHYLDCRVRAYPDQPALTKYFGLENGISPSVLMIDIDKSQFATDRAHKTALSKTLTNIKEMLGGAHPTVMWTGNGYHVIQPIEAVVLEEIKDFNEFVQPSMNILRFAEWKLSNSKMDPQHNRTVSFGNCLLRIPGSHNSKCVAANGGIEDEKTEVRIIQKWNGYKPHIRSLLGSYYAYLVDQKRKNNTIHGGERHWITNNNQEIPWIEKLLKTPLPDYRKMIIWLVLSRYLINIRGMTYDQAFQIIKEWTRKCNQEKPLYPSYFDSIIRDRLRQAMKDKKYPIGLTRLKTENRELYNSLLRRLQH
jgi:Primase X